MSRHWSRNVATTSRALTLEEGVFTWKSPKRIAESLKYSADHSRNRKGGSYQSAMSMLTFYINRAGGNLDKGQREVLEKAKVQLRKLYGRD